MILYLDRRLMVLPFYFALCTSQIAFHRELRRRHVDPREIGDWVSEGADGTTHRFDPVGDDLGAVIVGVLPTLKGRAADGVIVHEAMHVWRHAREIIGERFPSGEFEAYAIQHISRRLFDAYDEQTSKRKRKGKP